MNLPKNTFKARLLTGQFQAGIWNSIPGPVTTEILAGAGFDWILVDTEHSPLEVTGALSALQIIAGYPDVVPIVRPASNDPVLIKRHLDQGAQTLLIPYVCTPEEAKAAVAATRYPPEGIRGVAGMTRASRYGKIAGYAECAAIELCVIVQVETGEAVERLEEIAAVEGVDAVFIGPADLAASLGYAGRPGASDVVNAVEDCIRRLVAMGKPAGLLTTDTDFAWRCITLGASFVAGATDSGLLAKGLASNLALLREDPNAKKA